MLLKWQPLVQKDILIFNTVKEVQVLIDVIKYRHNGFLLLSQFLYSV